MQHLSNIPLPLNQVWFCNRRQKEKRVNVGPDIFTSIEHKQKQFKHMHQHQQQHKRQQQLKILNKFQQNPKAPFGNFELFLNSNNNVLFPHNIFPNGNTPNIINNNNNNHKNNKNYNYNKTEEHNRETSMEVDFLNFKFSSSSSSSPSSLSPPSSLSSNQSKTKCESNNINNDETRLVDNEMILTNDIKREVDES